MGKSRRTVILTVFTVLIVAGGLVADDVVRVGLNYPETGPYSDIGLDQHRAALLALEEINTAGGILGKQVEMVSRDSQCDPDVSVSNAASMIQDDGVKMVFGGASSAVAISVARVCHSKDIPFFGTLTYSTATTGRNGYHTTFRECYDSWMAAKAIGDYLNMHLPGKKYFYITADYTWGWTTEQSVRNFTNTDDEQYHNGIRTPFPDAADADFRRALQAAQKAEPDILVLVLFGNDLTSCIKRVGEMGFGKEPQIVVPNLTLSMAESVGPKLMEGVIGALPWTWTVPYKFNYPRGQEFVEHFADHFSRYPSTSGASAYTILYEYKAAVERAGTFETEAVIKALENHEYKLLKDTQRWRDFDHQSIQTVYLVKCKPANEVMKDKYGLDYFEIISSLPGEMVAKTYEEWLADREIAGLRPEL